MVLLKSRHITSAALSTKPVISPKHATGLTRHNLPLINPAGSVISHLLVFPVPGYTPKKESSHKGIKIHIYFTIMVTYKLKKIFSSFCSREKQKIYHIFDIQPVELIMGIEAQKVKQSTKQLYSQYTIKSSLIIHS